MEQSLVIDLIHRTKGVLNTINKLTLLSREKFGDKHFREFFYSAIKRDIEKHNLLLNTYLNYIESTTPIPKRDTVTKLIEGVLKRYQVRLEEKEIKLSIRWEKDLPETVVPDEQLKFIFNSLLQFVLVWMPSGGNLEFLSRSFELPEAPGEGEGALKKGGKYIDIRMNIRGLRIPAAASEKGSGPSPLEEEISSDPVCRLVDRIVKQNQGIIKFESGARESQYTISVKLPVERRRVVYYHLTGE